MRLPRVRFTIRRMMVIVAIAAMLLRVGSVSDFSANLLFAVCFFVLPPVLAVKFLRLFEPGQLGWRIFAGHESQKYFEEPASLRFYESNTIADHDPDVVPLLFARSDRELGG